MIADVAGVGEFAIKCGGPPTVTRLLGAKTNQMRYDHERGSFRVEYEASAARRPPASSSTEQGEAGAEEAEGNTTAVPSTATNTTPMIECEIRCDADTWASSLDIVIDPPPQTIHALRRHRLSAGGGGLWLTISHDAVLAGGEERILAIVRRGLGVGSKDKGVVMVNGAKLVVDVEELPEAEIKQLTRQKRVKPARIPLDQPPVVGVIRKRREEWDSDGSGSSDKASSQQRQSQQQLEVSTSMVGRINTSGWMAQPAMPSPLSKWFTSAIEQATTTTRQAVAALTPAAAAATSDSGEGLALSSSKPPMQPALEALAWMQDYYSRPSISTDGWTPIADKSLSLHWRPMPSLSPTISIHRGEKVIEGVSAEELASIITSSGCRAQWDESFGSATVFESFGAGCHTSFVVSKAGFPFRDRGFYVASVMAYSPVASVSSSSASTTAAASSTATAATTGSLRRTTNNADADRPVDGRNTIFCVSTSFNPENLPSSSLFATAKYNPSSLPTGRVFLDGWILETLDPYTTEKYAIPSARCVRLAAVDFAGAIPGAVNASMNVALARGVLAVDAFVKRSTGSGNNNGASGSGGSVPVPTSRLPAPAIVLARRKPGEEDEQGDGAVAATAVSGSGGATVAVAGGGPATASTGGKSPMAWKLRWRDEERMCLGSSFFPASRTYWSILALKLSDRGGSGAGAGSGRNVSEDRTPKSSRIVGNGISRASPSPPPLPSTAIPTTTVADGSSNDTLTPETAAEASGSSSSTITTSSFRGRDRSLSSPPGDHHFNNHKQLRSSSSVFTVRGEVRPATDLLAAELVVDTKLYPEGYEITVHSRIRTAAADGKHGSDVVLLPAEPTMTSTGSNQTVLPFAYAVYTMPSSPLHSAGLHADRPPRHLVRMTLPTGQYQHSTVQDPLTGEMRGARPKPSWLVDMQEKGAVVEVRVAPIASVQGPRAVAAGTGGKSIVKINGVDVAVVGEKDSLTSVGREELQDERVSRMPVLSR
jgi:hypothetical protein